MPWSRRLRAQLRPAMPAPTMTIFGWAATGRAAAGRLPVRAPTPAAPAPARNVRRDSVARSRQASRGRPSARAARCCRYRRWNVRSSGVRAMVSPPPGRRRQRSGAARSRQPSSPPLCIGHALRRARFLLGCLHMKPVLYLAPVQRASGRSLLTLGLLNFLGRRAEKPGLFRPILEQGAKGSAEPFGVTFDEARRSIAAGEYEGLVKRIVAKFKEVEGRCDAVLCEGVDLGVIPAIGF